MGQLLFCLFLLLGASCHAQLIVERGVVAAPPANNNTSVLRVADGKVELQLCECESAVGEPNGLSCDKLGWFLTGFERQGQWVAGGGYVPLSHAICCRPCLPAELPPDASGRIPPGQTPLAVVSLGCHASTDTLPSRCEAGGSSFVSGYSEGIKVFTQQDTYYPVNAAHCCTPSLLLPNGDAWELERCGCHDSRDPDYPINCGGTDSHELLQGYIFYRLSPLGHIVPVGPAQCCKLCLSNTVHPINACGDLNGCSKRGVCNLGQCECFSGWTGPDCSQRMGGTGGGIPGWAIALIVLSSCAVAGMVMAALGAIIQAVAARYSASEDGDGDERQPLLLRIDPDDTGSVGSTDTEDEECGEGEELAEVEARVASVVARLGARDAAAASGSAGGEQVEPRGSDGGADDAGGDIELGEDAPAASNSEESHGGAAGNGAAAESAPGPAPAHAAQHGNSAVEEGGEGTPVLAGTVPAASAGRDDSEPRKEWHAGGEAVGPLAMVDCIVCMARPVQAALIPCGHIATCRRCSRRLARCPVCRKEIVRRQRLFV